MKKILAGIILLFSHPVFAQQKNSTENAFRNKLSKEAVGLSYQKVIYDPAYKTIPYPMGDVPAHTACAPMWLFVPIEKQELTSKKM